MTIIIIILYNMGPGVSGAIGCSPEAKGSADLTSRANGKPRIVRFRV